MANSEKGRSHLITFKVTDNEVEVLEILSEMFDSRSDMIRKIIFDFAKKTGPSRLKDILTERKDDYALLA